MQSPTSTASRSRGDRVAGTASSGAPCRAGATIRLAAEVYDLDGGAALGNPQVEVAGQHLRARRPLSIAVLGVIRATARRLAARRPGERDHVRRSPSSPFSRARSWPGARFRQRDPGVRRRGRSRLDVRIGAREAGDAHGWTEGLSDRAPGVRDRQGRTDDREAYLLDVTLAYASGMRTRRGWLRTRASGIRTTPSHGICFEKRTSPPISRSPAWRAEAVRAGDPSRSLVSAGRDPSPSISRSSLRTRRGPILSMPHFVRSTGSTDYGRRTSIAYSIAFGDSVSRSRAIAGMDTLEFAVMRKIPTLLNHAVHGRPASRSS